MTGRFLVASLLLAAAVGSVACSDPESVDPVPGAAGGSTADGPRFVGSEACRDCHADQFDSWITTAHAESLEEMSEEVAIGDFHGRPIEADGMAFTPYRDGDDYRIRVEGRGILPDGDHRVDRVVGRVFEQAYLTVDERGAWRLLPLSWSRQRDAWNVTHQILAEIGGREGDGRVTDTRATVFNDGCANCHATDYDAGYDLETDTYHSTVLEGSVSCESCHGPGREHVAWHEASRGAEGYAESDARLLHPYLDLDPQEQSDSCGRCHYLHEWRFPIDPDPRTPHHALATSQNRDAVGFFADGRLKGLNYTGSTMAWSKCVTVGEMSCLTCHDMHGGKRWAMRYDEHSPEQCASCHADIVAEPEAHSHHQTVSCVDCHMPRHLEGVLASLRDHSLTSPEPELTERFGADVVPNACSECHEEEGVAWNRRWREEWWGPTDSQLVADVGLVVGLRQAPLQVPLEPLIEVALDPERRRFFRLTAGQALATRPSPTEVIRRLLADDDQEMRVTIVEALAVYPRRPLAFDLEARLDDHDRNVRIEAAYALTRLGWRADVGRHLDDARGMLERQSPTPPMLERLLVFSEIQGEYELFDHLWPAWHRTQDWEDVSWTPVQVEVVLRRVRRLLDDQRAEEALELLRDASRFAPGPTPVWMELDLAEARRRLGGLDAADAILRRVANGEQYDSLTRAIAAIRLGLRTDVPPAPSEAAKRLAGELLLRVDPQTRPSER